MSRYRARLPPLDTLIFFECAVRSGSFTRAAKELLVSQAAVSKRIGQLETWLDMALFLREGQKLVPTAVGSRLGDSIGAALEFIDQAFAGVRTHHDPAVRIGSMAAVNMFWLQAKLRAFTFSDDACSYSLTISDTPGDFLTGSYDLMVTYGDGKIPGWITQHLFGEELVPVASPAIFDALAKAEAAVPRLDYRRMAPDWVNWSVWSRHRDCPMVKALPRKICTSYAQSIGLALDGKGVALGSVPMLNDELISGRLVRLPVEGLHTKRGYWIARSEARVAHKGVLDAWKALTEHSAET